MITDERFNRLNEPGAGFQVREITDGNASAFELKSIWRPIKVGNSGSVKGPAESPAHREVAGRDRVEGTLKETRTK